MSTNKTLVVFGKFPGHHIYLDKILLKAAKEAQHEIDSYHCPGLLPYCPALDVALPPLRISNLATILNRFFNRTILRPVTCLKCKRQLRRSFPELHIKAQIVFSLDVLRSYIFAFKCLFSPSKLRQELSASIHDGTISCYLVQSRFEASDLRHTISLSLFLAARKYHIRCAISVLSFSEYQSLIMFNGRMMPFKVFLNQAQLIQPKLPVFVHERGFEDSSFIIKVNESAHSRDQLKKLITDDPLILQNLLSNSDVTQWADQFYQKRLIGKNTDCVLPQYNSEHISSCYVTTEKLIVVYLTTPDEIDPSSNEFELIENQWVLIPRICSLLSLLPDIWHPSRIVIRLHPNFFTRHDAPLANLPQKLGMLRSSLATFHNVYIDDKPHLSSPYAIYKRSSLTVTLASSAALESEYLGVPALVPSDHLYSFGCSYKFDFSTLLEPMEVVRPPDSALKKLNCVDINSRLRFLAFSYLWFYLDKYHFTTLKSDGFFGINSANIEYENSSDYLLLLESMKAHHSARQLLTSKVSSCKFSNG